MRPLTVDRQGGHEADPDQQSERGRLERAQDLLRQIADPDPAPEEEPEGERQRDARRAPGAP